jgi:predicted transcriptional regulator
VPAETNIDSFSLTPLQKQQLREVFATEDIHGKFEDIAGQQASHITHIHGRNDLHTAVDLAFHSPLSFDFEGVRLRKGWLEILIIGDTRTGKGFVTEGLARHYRVGEVVSGENMSLAGIIGGVQHIGDRWTLVWGKLPLADKRLVILDECGSLTHSEIGKLSRIRSEGVAEITKVISEKTTARTRIIWLANPRSTPGSTMPTVIADFNYGIEAVPALIGSAEDVARFDYALIVSREDVPLELINKTRKDNTPLRYSSELCHALIMWAWSRKPEQIVFDEDVTPLALQAAKALGNTFSARICLIQGADVRHKLARIATAAAARTFSTEDGEILRVRRKHMEFAYNFLYHIYSKACSGYLQLSEAEVERSVLRNPEAVQHALQLCGGDIADLIDGLLEHRLITLTDICDYANIELGLARSIISALVRARALIKENHGYTKKEAFKKMLRALKHKLARAKNQEQPVSDEGMEDEYAHGDRTSEHPGGNGELNAEHTGETERTDTLSGNASESV